MKGKEILYLLGWRPRAKDYGYEVRSFDMGADGRVEYAQWLHPRETTKEFSPEAVQQLRRFLSPGDVAIDIGAHTGDSTLPMALAVGGSGCVLALEPNPYVFPVLAKNAELNPDKTHIVPLPFAAAAEDAELTFHYSDSGYCNGGRFAGVSGWRHGHAFGLRVQGRDLQVLLRREFPELVSKIRYIKIDTEGGDEAVVRSLAALIGETRPYLRIEVYGGLRAEERRSLYRLLSGFGYTLQRIRDESDYRGERLAENDLGRWRQLDVFCVPAPR